MYGHRKDIISSQVRAGRKFHSQPEVPWRAGHPGTTHACMRAQDGCTPLLTATECGAAAAGIDIMRLLLDRGADPNAQKNVRAGGGAMVVATPHARMQPSCTASSCSPHAWPPHARPSSTRARLDVTWGTRPHAAGPLATRARTRARDGWAPIQVAYWRASLAHACGPRARMRPSCTNAAPCTHTRAGRLGAHPRRRHGGPQRAPVAAARARGVY
jgi:hypothetical protein